VIRRSLLYVIGLAFSIAASVVAQNYPKIEIPLGFSFVNVHPDIAPITSFNIFGGGGGVVFNITPVVGIKADFMGYTQGNGLRTRLTNQGFTISGDVQGNLFTYMFGPQFKKHSGKWQPFGEALFGAAHSNSFANIYNTVHGVASASSNNNAFAMEFGGGVDFVLGRNVQLRPIEVDYLYTRFGVNGTSYTGKQNNFKYLAGLNFTIGGTPPPPPTASCTISPSEVTAGQPVTARIATQNFNPKHAVTYSWSGTGLKVSGAGETGNIDTTGLPPGNYSTTATATDAKEKKNNTASCSAIFTVKEPPRHPPVANCSASPTTVKAGDPSTISVDATSPDAAELTYSYSTTVGNITGSGSRATLDTASVPPGSSITTTVTVTDSRGLTTTCMTTVNVLSPPVTVQQVSEVGECKFVNPKKPWRVDNECKAVLDDVALRLQREPNGKLVVVGYSEDEEKVKYEQLGAQRAVNVKYYLTSGEGRQKIDPAMIEPRVGTKGDKSAKFYIVPAGATFSAEETTVVDENAVRGQSRNAPRPKKKSVQP
jgi:hypothetical protein